MNSFGGGGLNQIPLTTKLLLHAWFYSRLQCSTKVGNIGFKPTFAFCGNCGFSTHSPKAYPPLSACYVAHYYQNGFIFIQREVDYVYTFVFI